ncbi:MAG: hypothetical protein GY749_22820 [Desulfobacteraceae bacterium]|nr:hypothetical protein [Desulfobacteraceae bacterium]
MTAKKPRQVNRRKQLEHIGHRQTLEIPFDVDNPYYNRTQDGEKGNDKTIKAVINMRESVPAYWFHKDMIDAAQYRASTEFRRFWERSGGKGAGSFDYAKDKVDGGTMSDAIDIGQMEASRKLKEIHNLIGQQGYDVVLKICGQIMNVSDLSNSRSERDRLSSLCKEMLTRIAEYLGYKDRNISRSRKAS